MDLIDNKIFSDEKPLITFALFTYNQERYIREALEGVMAQTYSPLEIVVSDDCSTDRTFEIIKETVNGYAGPHQIVLNRNYVNFGVTGIGKHVNRVFELATGELIVFAAGDDISFPNRVAVLVDMWMNAKKPTGSIHSAVETINEASEITGHLIEGLSTFGKQTIADCIRKGSKGVLGASHAITRDIYDYFGPLPEDTLFEDRTLAFRSLLRGMVLYCPECLVKYRQHEGNVSGKQIHFDANRWERFNKGEMSACKSFHRDYVLFMENKSQSRIVLDAINTEIKRVNRTRGLITGNALQRIIAAYYYTYDVQNPLHRLSFILNQAGFDLSFLKKILKQSMLIIKNSKLKLI